MSDEQVDIGKKQSRYELREKLGAGGAGTVYKAWDTQLRRFVAFKRLREEIYEEKDIDNVFREAMNLACLQHPNILTVYDTSVDSEGPYIVTEYLEGKDVSGIVKSQGPFSMNDLIELVHQTLEGMIAAHHVGLIHRDLKPQNIMRTRLPSGATQYKILDFGLARIVSKPTLQTVQGDSIYGTIYYVAPEQLTLKPLDIRTDLYALGCIYYYVLTGEHAFDGPGFAQVIERHIKHDVKPVQDLRPDLQDSIADWIMMLMSPEPEDRPASPKAALDAFDSACKSDTSVLRVKPLQEPAVVQKKRMNTVLLVILVAVSTVLVALILWFGFPGRQKKGAEHYPGATLALKDYYDPCNIRELWTHVGKYITLRGEVVRVNMNRNRTAIYINFDQNFKQAASFSFLIAKHSEEEKDIMLEQLEAYIGKTVQGSGPLEAYRSALNVKILAMEDLQVIE